MLKTTKPQRGGWGLERGKIDFSDSQNLTTRPRAVQLFGVFDRDTMNAVIVTAREVSA